MRYPLSLSFKIVALAPQLKVTDGDGANVCYVRQKMFKLKEAVEVFTDESRSEKLCDIRADRVLDFSARYTFYDRNGEAFGAVQRKGLRSFWRARYEILDHGTPELDIHEENGWVKLMDGIFSDLPIIGMFSGYLFHPTYLISRLNDGTPIVRIKKQPAFWEGRFVLEQIGAIDDGDQLRVMLSTLMMILLERNRG